MSPVRRFRRTRRQLNVANVTRRLATRQDEPTESRDWEKRDGGVDLAVTAWGFSPHGFGNVPGYTVRAARIRQGWELATEEGNSVFRNGNFPSEMSTE